MINMTQPYSISHTTPFALYCNTRNAECFWCLFILGIILFPSSLIKVNTISKVYILVAEFHQSYSFIGRLCLQIRHSFGQDYAKGLYYFVNGWVEIKKKCDEIFKNTWVLYLCKAKAGFLSRRINLYRIISTNERLQTDYRSVHTPMPISEPTFNKNTAVCL